ncbi:hypothetical protein KAU11_07165 [Candidatus Babeliales bacterium]|nr:hypothetical protein [Candidatus Babeliales bacterium]
MKYLLVLMMIFLSACSESGRIHNSIAPEFEPYLEAFILDSVENGNPQTGKTIPINFHNLPVKHAQCKNYSFYKDGTKRWEIEILIDPKRWETLPELNRKSLIYHELGHCLLSRQHDDTLISFDLGMIRSSIMNNDSAWTLNGTERDDYYLNELFNY